MTNFPKFVEFHEEGLREGFQIEPRSFPIERRAELVEALAASGLKHIEIGSIVNPRKVPTMADTPELWARIKKRPDVKYTVLWLNQRGFERARQLPDLKLSGLLLFYASDALARANNDRSAEQMRIEQFDFVKMYEEASVPIRAANIICAFGCNLEGAIPIERVTGLIPWIKEITVGRGHPMPVINLCDTMGWANPEQMKRVIGAVREVAPEARVGTHIHDTRGLGIANVYAALQMGVDLFDSSVGGLGGCPFAGHSSARAAGNISTEDAVYLCHELGIETGIDLDRLIDAASLAETIIGDRLTGKVMHSGSLQRFRQAR